MATVERTRARELLQFLPLLRRWRERNLLTEGKDQRAFIVEFAGMPKAGKSSAIETLKHFFSHGHKDSYAPRSPCPKDLRYNVHTPAEGVSLRTPGQLKSNLLDFNTWAGAYAVQELLQASHDSRNDMVILDRGPWDAGCWLEHWMAEQQGPQEERTDADTVAQFFH